MDKKPRSLGLLYGEGTQTTGSAINNAGVVIGSTTTKVPYQWLPFIWRDGVFTELGTLDGNYASADSLNAKGVVVGLATVPDPTGIAPAHAVLWKNGKTIDLNTRLDAKSKEDGWVLYQASRINDAGQVLGVAVNRKTNLTGWYPFVLTPMPR